MPLNARQIYKLLKNEYLACRDTIKFACEFCGSDLPCSNLHANVQALKKIQIPKKIDFDIML